jgi:O-antigen/teichoic acid export membrane protein
MSWASAGRRDAVWAMLGQVVGAGASLGRGVLVARLASPDDLGRLFLMLSAGALVAGFGQTGVAVVGLRRVSAAVSSSEVSATIHAAVSVTAMITVAVVALGAAVLAALHVPVATILAFTLLSTAQLWLGLFAALVRGLQRVSLAVRHEQVIAPVLQCALLAACLLIKPRWSLTALITVFGIALVPSVASLSAPIARAVRRAGSPVESKRAAVIAESVPVLVNAGLWRALNDAPLWAAGIWFGPAATALLGIAQRFAALLQLPLVAAVTVVAPRASLLYSRGATLELEQLLRRAAMWATYGSALALVLMLLSGRAVLRAVFGPFFESAFTVSLVLAVGQVINSATGIGGTALLMMGQARPLLRISFISTVFLAALVAAGVATSSLTGLAWAWVGGFTCQNILMIVAVYRLAHVRVYMSWR